MNEFDLTGEYFEAYQQVKLCARSYAFSGKKYDEAMQNLFDVLYTAQQNDRAVEMIIGYDIEQFTKSYFSEYTIKDYLQTLFSDMTLFMVIMFAVTVFDFLNGKTQVNTQYVMFSAVFYMIMRFIGYLRKKLGYQKYLFLSTCASAFIVASFIQGDWYIDVIYPLVICGLWTLVYGGLWLFNRFKHR